MPHTASTSRAARLCIYCGSNAGSDPAYRNAATQLGEAMARRNIALVYKVLY